MTYASCPRRAEEHERDVLRVCADLGRAQDEIERRQMQI